MIDCVIRNATRYDGSGGPPTHGDIGIDAGRIVSLGERIADGAAGEEIDVGGTGRRARIYRSPHPFRRVASVRTWLYLRSRAGRHDPGCRSLRVLGRARRTGEPGRLVEEEPVFAFPGRAPGIGRRSAVIGRRSTGRGRPRMSSPSSATTASAGSSSGARTGRRPRPSSIGWSPSSTKPSTTVPGGSRPGCRTRRIVRDDRRAGDARPSSCGARPPLPHAMRYGPDGVVASVREALERQGEAGSMLNISHHVSPRRPRARGRRRTAGDARRRAATGDRGHLRPDGLPAGRRGMGPVPSRVGARRRTGGDGGRDPGSRLARAAGRVPRRPGCRLVDGGLGRPADLQGQPPRARRPRRPIHRRDRAGTRSSADRHRARPRPRGRTVLDRSDDQEPGPSRPAHRQPVVRPDRRRFRPPSGAGIGRTGSCRRASGRSRWCSGRTSGNGASCLSPKRSARSRPSLPDVSA